MNDDLPKEDNPEQVTFLLPIKLPAPYLQETLESIVSQDCDAWKLLVIIDGHGGDLVRRISAIVPSRKLKIVPAQGGTGIVAGLNTGLALVDTTYAARIDADDVCHASRVRKQLAALNVPERPILSCSAANVIDERGNRIGSINLPPSESFRELLSRRNHVVHSSVMFRTEEVRRVGGYNASCDSIEDYDLWLRCARTGEISALNTPLVSYRISDGQISRRASRRTSRMYIMAGQLELASSVGRNRVLTFLSSLAWMVAQEPALRNRLGRLRKLRS